MTKTLIVAAGLGLFLMRGPDACTGYAQTGPAPTAPTPECLHPVGPDRGGVAQSVANAVNAENGC